jgi:putative transposase
MLDKAIERVKASQSRPVVHSDCGAHYLWPGWLSRTNNAKLVRSMSHKGCPPDNAACERFIGKLKTELLYPPDWQGITVEQFIQIVDAYIRCCNKKQIKVSLESLRVIQYRKSLGLAAYVSLSI